MSTALASTARDNKRPLGRPRKFTDAEEMQQAIDAYFSAQDAAGKPYTMAGLARALDCGTKTLRNYEDAEHAAVEFVQAVKRARQRVEEWTEERLFGKGHPAGPIFSLKNNFGWKDQQEVQHTHELIVGAPGALIPAEPKRTSSHTLSPSVSDDLHRLTVDGEVVNVA